MMQEMPPIETNESPPVLEYGRQSSLRRRIRKGVFISLALAAVVGGLWYAIPSVMHAIRLKTAVAECNAWAEKARTSVLPEGTLLYSETSSNVRLLGNRIGTVIYTINKGTSQPTAYVTGEGLASQYPALREVAYLAGGIPVLSSFRNYIYVHEHPLWLAPTGSPPPIFSIYYLGPSPNGDPQFGVMARTFPLDAKGQSNMVGGMVNAQAGGRAFTNLRLFAGQPHPTDPTRFAIPFSCDLGSGRFEFQTDMDASDGGEAVPRVIITWEDSPTTQPK